MKGSLGKPVHAVIPPFLAELLELPLHRAFDPHFMSDPLEKGNQLGPRQVALDIELLGDAIIS